MVVAGVRDSRDDKTRLGQSDRRVVVPERRAAIAMRYHDQRQALACDCAAAGDVEREWPKIDLLGDRLCRIPERHLQRFFCAISGLQAREASVKGRCCQHRRQQTG